MIRLSLIFLVLVLFSCKQKTSNHPIKKDSTLKSISLFYDESWVNSPEYRAEYYRKVTVSDNDKPIGEINDYLISGEKYANYEKSIEFDRYNVSKCKYTGTCTFYHKNGEVREMYQLDANGNKQGWLYNYNRDGKLIRKTEYKDNSIINQFEYKYIESNDDGESSFLSVQSIKSMKPIEINTKLPTPPEILFDKQKRFFSLIDFIQQFHLDDEMGQLIEACNYQNAIVRNTAVMLASSSPGNFNLGQICDIFDFSYQNWSYVNDPVSLDYFAKASETISNKLNGDCDDFAILMCSLILSIGGEARINFAYDQHSGHAFTEINIGKTNVNSIVNYLKIRYKDFNNINYRTDNLGNKWLNLDWWANYPGGKYFNYTKGETFNILYNTHEKF